jgi:cation:H+ antiporter
MGNMIFQILIILGIVTIIKCNRAKCISFKDTKSTIRRDGIFMLISGFVLLTLLLGDNEISSTDGYFMIAIYVSYILLVLFTRSEVNIEEIKDVKRLTTRKQSAKAIGIFIISLIGIIYSSILLNDSVLNMDRTLNLGEAKIGVIILGLAIGVPELIFNVIGILREKKDIVIGSLIGATIFDNLVSIGLPSIIDPITITTDYLIIGVIFFYGMTSFIMAVIFMRTRWELTKLEGYALILIYLLYLIVVFATPFS